MIDRKVFYSKIRESLFKKLSQSQVDGIEAILDEWEKQNLPNLKWLAYILATAYHETAFTMQPIEEFGKGKGKPYGKIDEETRKSYYGRGFVQLTWGINYINIGNTLGIDLYYYPEKALELNIAAKILVSGMINGWFTGRKLSKYFNPYLSDWYNARRIINGLDCAEKISQYGKKFYEALLTT